MSQKKPALPKGSGSATRKLPALSATQGGRPWTRWVLAALILAGLLLGAGWWWRRMSPSLPAVDLSRVDPKVAANLRARMQEIRDHPRSAPAWGWLGALLWVYDFRTAAGEYLSRAERLDATNPRWPYYHARALLIATPNQALPLLQQTVRLCGNSPEAPRFRLARLLAEQGRWEDVRREVEPLLAEKPDFAPARLLAAQVAQARGELDRAIELARGCAGDPRTAHSAWVLLAMLLRQKGDLPAAAQAVQRSAAISSDEGFDDPYQAEVTLLRGDPRALTEQAHPLLAAGRLTEAAALIARLRQEHSAYPETWLLVGRLQFLRKDLPGAEQSLRKYIELSPRSAEGLFHLGVVLLALERFPEAASVFERAGQLKPDYGPAWYNRGLALGRSGQLQDAAAAFHESLRHNPERLDTYVLLADLHLRLNQPAQARALLAQAQSLKPDDPRLRSLRARADAAAQ